MATSKRKASTRSPRVDVDRRAQEGTPSLPAPPVGTSRPPRPLPARVCEWPGCERVSTCKWQVRHRGPVGRRETVGAWYYYPWCPMHYGRIRRGQDMETGFLKLTEARWDYALRLFDAYRDMEGTEEEMATALDVLKSALVGWAKSVRYSLIRPEVTLSAPIPADKRMHLPEERRKAFDRLMAATKSAKTLRRLYGSDYYQRIGQKAAATRHLRNEWKVAT